jgi:hypothetical protein
VVGEFAQFKIVLSKIREKEQGNWNLEIGNWSLELGIANCELVLAN